MRQAIARLDGYLIEKSLSLSGRGYELEFMDEDGRSCRTLPAHQVAPLRGRQILHGRPLTAAQPQSDPCKAPGQFVGKAKALVSKKRCAFVRPLAHDGRPSNDLPTIYGLILLVR